VEQCLDSNPQLCLKAVTCFKSWAQFGIQLPDIENLTTLIYQVSGSYKSKYLISLIKIDSFAEKNLFTDSELAEAALDALLAVATQPESGKYPSTLLKMSNQWLRLHQIVKQHQERDMVKLLFICQSLRAHD
jgi:hypothetical protein